MIRIDKEKTEMMGSRIVLISELGTIFNTVNRFLDANDNNKMFGNTVEEMLICDPDVYKDFCQMCVRLNEAHKRVEDKMKSWEDRVK